MPTKDRVIFFLLGQKQFKHDIFLSLDMHNLALNVRSPNNIKIVQLMFAFYITISVIMNAG